MNRSVEALFADHPAIAIAQHPRQRTTLWRLRKAGELTSPYPGVLVRAADDRAFTMLAAVALWSAPKGVIHGISAAQVWSGTPIMRPVRVSHPSLRSRPGVQVTRHRIPTEFVITERGMRLATPAFVAAELAGSDGGELFAEFLRTGLARQSEMTAALVNFTDCPGQSQRRLTFRNCECGPWSFAEVRLHQILLDAKVSGWRANAAIRIAGHVFHPDVLFDDDRLVLEFDGHASHHAKSQFIRDRERQNLLVLAGYRVLRFTWEHLDDPDYIVEAVTRSRNEMHSQHVSRT